MPEDQECGRPASDEPTSQDTRAPPRLARRNAARLLAGGGLSHPLTADVFSAGTGYREAPAEREIAVSLSRAGDCYDDAMGESFLAALKVELLDTCLWPTPRAAWQAIFEWVEVWYNRNRSHAALGDRRPVAFERARAEEVRAA